MDVEDVRDLMNELTALAVSQSQQQQSRAQAIAAGQTAGSQDAPHDADSARVSNVYALSASPGFCAAAGCGKAVKS